MKKEVEKIKRQISRGRKIFRRSVNIFLYFIIGILVILLIAFGITQTSVFRNWLKNAVVEELNNTMNGKISIEKLEGTIFTSLVLKNTLVTFERDTVLSAEHIELKTSPLKLLFKIIYLRKIELRNTFVYLREDSLGVLNILKLFPPSEDVEEDTTSAEFPFAFQVADFQLNNINFVYQSFDNINSNAFYESVNAADLRISDLTIKLSAFADISKNSYQLKISEFSFYPNFKFFNLRWLEGEFFATQNGILISGLNIITEESEISLNAGITDLNVFSDFTEEELRNAPFRLQIQSDKLSFSDVSTFIPDLNILKGKISINASADGSINDFIFDNLQVGFENTLMQSKVEIKNLLDSDNLSFYADLSGSVINPDDPFKLMPSLGTPSYAEFGIIAFDTLITKGNLTNIESNLFLSSGSGATIFGEANLNFQNDRSEYDIGLFTRKLNIKPFVGFHSDLSTSLKIRGSGYDPSSMNANIVFNVDQSSIGDAYIEDLKLFTKTENGSIESNLNISIDTSTTLNLISNFDFTQPEDPFYKMEMFVNNINIGKIISDENLNSRINFNLQAEGKGFNPDSLDLFMFMHIKETELYDFKIDSTLLILDVRRNDNGKKIINIISEIADLTISGQYSINTIADVISAEIEVLQSSFFDKYSFLFRTEADEIPVVSAKSKTLLAVEEISLDYLVDFKDFLTLKLGNSEIEIDGSITGNIVTTQDSVLFSSTVELNYFKFWDYTNLYFLTRTKLDFGLWNKIESGVLENFSAFFFFRTNRLYAGSNFYDIGLSTSFEDDSVSLNFNARMEDYLNFKLQGLLNVDTDLQQLIAQFDSMKIKYNNLEIKNTEKLVVNYSDYNFEFDKINLSLAEGLLGLAGNFGFEGDGLLNVFVKDVQWRELAREILSIDDDINFDAEVNMEGNLSGNISDPKLEMKLSLNDLIFQEKNLGSLLSDISFINNQISSDIKFIDSLRTIDIPKLKIYGTIPLKLTSNEEESFSKNEMDIKIISDDFDLSSLGNALPMLNDISGNLNINLNITGELDNPVMNGIVDIHNTLFTVEINNLKYNFETKVSFDQDKIRIDYLTLGNVLGTRFGGTLSGNGEIQLDKFNISSAILKARGDLKVLDRISREVNPVVYGDLAVQTDGEVLLTINDNTSFVDIPINVTVADLNFTLPQSAYTNTSGFIYRFAEYVDSNAVFENGLDSLIKFAEKNKLEQNGEQTTGYFDYRIRVNMQTEAKMVVILSRELNQNLTAVMDGNFELSSRGGRTFSIGQLNLLEGSKLSFIKTLEVTGNVRVEKLDDPLLNITAIYRNYYYPADTTGTAEEVEVAVKIRFNGPLSELGKNFIRDEENIAVYVGSDKIESDERDPTKTTSDAFLFLIAGKFTDGATTQEINAAASTATSLAGSVLGGVLNKYLGDYVRSVQLRQVGSETKFNLIGKAGKFRYEIGGSTDVFQDLSRANVKIEYPIIRRLLLRLERKESINETTLSNDMFNELGLKYRFDF